jgi:hypothetical protein
MPNATGLAKDDPRMIAWDAWTQTPEYANTLQWAAHGEHRKGSLWAAFLQGYETGHPMTPEKPRHDGEWVSRAAMSLAKMVDEYTHRGWNEKGLADFAHIVERRLKRFVPTLGTQEGEEIERLMDEKATNTLSSH